MGVRLIVEVLDHWQDIGLTAGERGDLLVLAENANDKSRETWGPVHAPHILKRAGKAAPSWRIAINRLMKKKALEFAKRDGKEVRGYTGQHAVYRLVELCPAPPHSGYKGLCTKPEKEGHPASDPAQEEGYPSANPLEGDQEEGYLTANAEGYLTANAVDGEGYLTATERVSGQLTPTPLVSSFDLSSKDSPSSSVAEDVPETSAADATVEEGGGGGDSFLEKIHNESKRVDAFVASLPFPGRPPGKQQSLKIRQRLTVAFKAGWSERGLARYLDISDDASVRSAAAVYLHRLSEEELPDAGEAEPAEPTGERVLPPVCDSCERANPAARTNVRFRTDSMSFQPGALCPRCHPDMVGPDRPGADGGMWDRAMARAQARMGARADAHTADDYASSSVDDLYGPPILPGDRNVAGWAALSRSPALGTPQPQIARNRHQNYQPPSDPSVYNNGFRGGYEPYRDPEDQSVYDKDL